MRIILLLCFLCLIRNLNAQEQLSHTKKFYINPKTQTLYWPSESGMFIFVSDDSTGKNLTKLESKATPEYANPMYLDTEGKNYIRSKWAVDKKSKKAISPQKEILFEVYKDSYGPKTLKIKNKDAFVRSNINYYSGEVTFDFKAKDEMSGLDATYYAIDGQDFKKYNSVVSITKEGKHKIAYYSVDNVGNVEQTNTYSFVIDNTLPLTNFELIGSTTNQNILTKKNKFKLVATDNSSGIKTTKYSIDDNQKSYYKEISLYGIKDGKHELKYYSIDNLGNEEKKKSYEFIIDNTPPEVDIQVTGDQYQSRGRVFISSRTNIEIKAQDELSGVDKIIYAIDDSDEKIYKEPFPLKKSTGEHIIKYRAIDKAGNGSVKKVSDKYLRRKGLDLDVNPPKIYHQFVGSQIRKKDTMFITSKTKIELSAKDLISGVDKIGYKVDGGIGKDYEKPFTVEEEKLHNVNFFATDLVKNRNIDNFIFFVDNKGPELSYELSSQKIGDIKLENEEMNVYYQGTKLFLIATDKQLDIKSIYFKLNGAKYSLYSSPIILNQKGKNTFQFKAKDDLGNESISKEYILYIN